MMPVTNRKLVLAARPEGLIKDSDFNLEEEIIEDIDEGNFLVKTQYLSLAPVMKFYMIDGAGIEAPLAIGETMRGRGVGEVVASKHPKFKIGDIVQGKLGWQEYRVCDGSPYYMMYHVTTHDLPSSTALGVLGITGCTSYFGLFDVGRLKEGDNVLVSAAAGGVGCIIGQLAKIKGARAVGLSSKDEKCRLLKEKLGYYETINYKTENVSQKIDEYFPEGIDVYFDNVGGQILDIALSKIRQYARIVLCGRIATYQDDLKSQSYLMKNWHMVGSKRASMNGFFIYDFENRFEEAKKQMALWVKEGKLSYHEDVLEGLTSMPAALNRLFEGKNIGKQLVKIS